jgi:hypothetical protein
MGDPDGIVLSDLRVAKREAVGWARDFTRHNFQESIRSWKVIVTDENADVVLTVPLSEARPWKITRFFLDLDRLISKLGSRVLVLSLAAAIVFVVVHAGLTTAPVKEAAGVYELASVATGSSVLAVRFAPDASLADITKFLTDYKTSLVDGPGPGGLYKLRIARTSLPRVEIEALIKRMAQDKVVEFVAAAQ